MEQNQESRKNLVSMANWHFFFPGLMGETCARSQKVQNSGSNTNKPPYSTVTMVNYTHSIYVKLLSEAILEVLTTKKRSLYGDKYYLDLLCYFAIHTGIIKSLSYTPETNKMLYVNYNSTKK